MKKLLSFLFLICAVFAFAQDLPSEDNSKQEESKNEIATFAAYQEVKTPLSFAKPFNITINLQKQATLAPSEQEDFEIVDIDTTKPEQIILNVVPFNLGVSTFTATLIDDNGNFFDMPPLPLEIKQVKTKYDAENLLDIRGPKKFSSWLKYLIIILLILAAICYFIYRKSKRKKEEIKLKIANPYLDETKTPEEVALSQIDSLLLKDLWETKQYKLFYIYLTDILRDYLTARFKFDAHNFTTKDLLRYIKKRQDFKSDLVNPLEIFLKSSDFVKFARAVPTAEHRDKNLSDLRLVIKGNAKPVEAQNKTKEVKK